MVILFRLLVFPGFLFLFFSAMLFDWVDRRVIARFQERVGPPWYQPFADFVKLLAKEDVLSTGAHATAASLLPVAALVAVLTAALYVPVGGIAVASFEGDLILVLFLLSVPAISYFLVGWISVGVYSVIGGNRSLLQYFSYEVPFLMALAAPAALSGTWSIARIVAYQGQTSWGLLMQPLGFILAMIGLVGKLKRDPLDIPKAKSEVIAGPLTEFSGRKLALWHLAMEMQTVVGIFLLVNLFVGDSRFFGWLPQLPVFGLKALALLVLLSMAAVLYARLRIDQLADLGWKILAPLALLQFVATLWIIGL